MSRSRRLTVLVVVGGLLTACTSPGSVRTLSASQAERLERFADTLSAAVEVARADRKARLTALIRNSDARLEDVKRDPAARAEKSQWIDEETQRIAVMRAQLAANEAAYASLPIYVREVLIPGNAALDEWHNRPGVSLIDSDAVAQWAAEISSKGITLESVRSLSAGVQEETKGEIGQVKSELKRSFDASAEARSLAEQAVRTAADADHRIAELVRQIEELRRVVEQLKGAK
jgi:hypothetical protein